MSKNVDEVKTCSVCGTALSGVDESCAVCMLRKGLAGGVESGESSAAEDMVKPTTPEQAVQRFERMLKSPGRSRLTVRAPGFAPAVWKLECGNIDGEI